MKNIILCVCVCASVCVCVLRIQPRTVPFMLFPVNSSINGNQVWLYDETSHWDRSVPNMTILNAVHIIHQYIHIDKYKLFFDCIKLLLCQRYYNTDINRVFFECGFCNWTNLEKQLLLILGTFSHYRIMVFPMWSLCYCFYFFRYTACA